MRPPSTLALAPKSRTMNRVRSRRLLRPFAAVALVVSLASGCSLVVPFDDYLKPSTDAGPDADATIWIDAPEDGPGDANCVGDVCIAAPPAGELVLAASDVAALEVFGNELYFLRDVMLDSGAARAELHLADVDGGGERLLGSGAGPVTKPYLVGQGGASGFLVWIAGTGNNELVHRYYDGGSVEALGSSSRARAVAYDRRRFFWVRSTGTAFYTAQDLTDAEAGASVSFGTFFQGGAAGIASSSDTDNLFISGGEEIREIAKDGTLLGVRASGEQTPGKLVVDDVLYAWINNPDGGVGATTGVRRKDRFGGGVEQVYRGSVVDLKLRDSVVYVLEADGRVLAVPRQTRSALVVARGPAGPRGITVTAEHVYWAAPDGIRRVARPIF